MDDLVIIAVEPDTEGKVTLNENKILLYGIKLAHS